MITAVENGSETQLRTFDSRSGGDSESWTYNATSTFDSQATTVNTDANEVYVTTDDGFTILNASTGKTVGTVDGFTPNQLTWDQNAIYAVSDKTVRAVAHNGTELWNTSTPEEHYWEIERGPDGTVLVWNDTSVVMYDATDHQNDDRKLARYNAQNTIQDATGTYSRVLISEGDYDKGITRLQQVHFNGSVTLTEQFEGPRYEFNERDSGLYLVGDSIARLDDQGYIEWQAGEPLLSGSLVEINQQVAGIAADGNSVIAFDPDTGLSTSVYQSEDQLRWGISTDEKQLYTGSTSTVAAVEPPNINSVTISGTLTDATGTELTEDRIRVFSRDLSVHDESLTTTNGEYSLQVKANTTYYLYYDRLGEEGILEPERNGIADKYLFEPIEVGESDISADLTVPEGDHLNVTVTDQQGNPVENASVRVADIRHLDANSSVSTGTGNHSTAADGTFQLPTADEPGIELNGTVNVTVHPPEDADRFIDQEYTTEFTLNGSTTHTVELIEVPSDLPPVAGDSPPQDLTGDDLYEDITGSGSLTVVDVQVLFDNLDNEEIQNNAAAFNFSGTDSTEVTVADVHALWKQFTEEDNQ